MSGSIQNRVAAVTDQKIERGTTIMKKYLLLSVLVALLGGCGAPGDDEVTELG
jgi:hypothetical protein